MHMPTYVKLNEEIKVPRVSTSGEVVPDAMCMSLTARHRPEAEAQLNKNFGKFMPIKMKVSVADGATYEIRVDCGNGEIIHIKIFVPVHGYGGSCLIGVKQLITLPSK